MGCLSTSSSFHRPAFFFNKKKREKANGSLKSHVQFYYIRVDMYIHNQKEMFKNMLVYTLSI